MRKLKLIIILATVSILSVQCGDNNLTNSLKQEEYLPMTEGNSWTFAQDQWEWRIQIIGNASIDGKNYFVFERYFPSLSFGDSEYRLLREAAKNKIYINYKGKEFIYVDFNQPLNKPWPSYNGFEGKIVRKDFDIETPAGTFSNAVKVNFQKGPRQLTEIFAKGVGIVSDWGLELKYYSLKN